MESRAIAPGVAGGVCLLLAFFAFQILPVNMTGLLLIVFGIALLILELKVPSFGALGVGGTVSLILGSVMMTDAVPGVRVGLGVILPAALGFAAVFLFLGRLALDGTTAAAGHRRGGARRCSSRVCGHHWHRASPDWSTSAAKSGAP